MPSDVLALIARIRQLQTELNAVIDLSTEHEMEAAYQREIIAKMRPIVEAAVGYVTSTDSFTTSIGLSMPRSENPSGPTSLRVPLTWHSP